LSFQWYSNDINSNTTGGTSIGGATGASYTPPTTSLGTFYYYVVVTNTIADNGDGGVKTATATSTTAQITVNNSVNAQQPNITTHPASASYARNAVATLTVTATSPDGGTITHQWYSNTVNSNADGTLIGGQTGASYTPPTTTEGTFYYYVVVTNTITDNGDGGVKIATLASNAATITVYETFTVTYDDNDSTDGAVPVDSNSYTSGATVTVLGNTGSLVKDGHNFNGWNTVADGSGGTPYAAGATFSITENTTLYAQWTPVTFTVTYDDNDSTDGAVPVDSNSYTSGQTVTVLGNTGSLEKTGYNFAGWNTLANGSGDDYMAGETFDITENTTLFAKWEDDI
jgi:uncharacterized repeat protein (TIGR02543 family)